MELERPPKSWNEMSLDMRLFFSFHICMMGLMLAHLALGAGFDFELAVVCCAAVAIITLSIRNRIQRNWHWSGTNWKSVVGALVALVFGVYFLGAVLPGTTISNPRLFPWLCAGGGIITFAILNSLNVVQQTDERFEAYCGEKKIVEPAPTPPTGPAVPAWKKVLVTAFQLYFLAVWIGSVGFFWKHNSAMSRGSAQPTATQTERLTDHGHTVYITLQDRKQVDMFQLALVIGIPSVFVIGGILHFGFGAKVFGKRPEHPS
jgi:hypothetical protein